MIWIYKCLEEHSLSEKLQCLLSNPKHLENCYEKSAFLCQKEYADAAVTCLRAVEQNQPSLLTELDPSLVSVGKMTCPDVSKLLLMRTAIYKSIVRPIT